MGMTDYYGKAYAREDVAVSGTAQSLTATVYSTSLNTDPRCAVVTVEGVAGTDSIRYTADGTTPNGGATPPVGDIHLPGNDPIVLWGLESIQKFRFLDGAGTGSVLHATYYK
jgi:hypothetical protein